MIKIWYYGDDKTVKTEFQTLVADYFTIEDFISYEEMGLGAILLIDMRKLNSLDWTQCWPDFLAYPRSLLTRNIKVIAIVDENYLDNVIHMLECSFADYFKYPFSHKSRLISTLKNTIRNIEKDQELTSLYQIGVELSTEQNLDVLIKKILNTTLEHTNADSGSIYLVTDERDPFTGEQLMQFQHSVSYTLGERYTKIKMPINDKSIVGYSINHGVTLNVLDAYNLPPDSPYRFNETLDKKNNYKSKTILCVPMFDHNNKVIGAIQLINKKSKANVKLTSEAVVDNYVLPFDYKGKNLIMSLSGQASIAIENGLLNKEIQDLFESFVSASIIAVESRDPTTGGHSRRVSELTVAIANLINITNEGPLADLHFSQQQLKVITYAGLLHDFGKIGIPEKVLVKAKKLYIDEMSIIKTRLRLYEYNQFVNSNDYSTENAQKITAEVEELRKAINQANEPGFLPPEVADKLKTANETEINFLDGETEKVLSDEEYTKLVYSRGSLSAEEYEIMKSHVEHSYNFLSKIVWPAGLQDIPRIARAHHEKLDGSGYPLGLKGDEIPIEAQIMCIADIFDALTSSDRPYKQKMPIERALQILKAEASQGKINKDILQLMIDSMIYHLILDK